MNKPSVSIIVPVYNVAPFIERCLKSVMSQTYTGKMECLIIDDCGTDDSIVISERMINEYNGDIRFQILHHKQNRGLSAARNTGTNAAIGDYLFYLDSDDELTVDCIEKLMKPVQNDPTIEMVMGSYNRFSDSYQLPPLQRILQEKDIVSIEAVRDYYYERNVFPVAAWNKLIKKEFLVQHQLFFKEGLLFEDQLWIFYVVKYLSHLYTMPDITYLHYKRPHSITTGTGKEERAFHYGMIYHEITNNLTVGDRREAKFYVRHFCSRCIKFSPIQSFRQASLPFKKTLLRNHYILEYILLSATLFLSKFALGRSLFLFARKTRRVIRSLFKHLCFR